MCFNKINKIEETFFKATFQTVRFLNISFQNPPKCTSEPPPSCWSARWRWCCAWPALRMVPQLHPVLDRRICYGPRQHPPVAVNPAWTAGGSGRSPRPRFSTCWPSGRPSTTLASASGDTWSRMRPARSGYPSTTLGWASEGGELHHQASPFITFFFGDNFWSIFEKSF